MHRSFLIIFFYFSSIRLAIAQDTIINVRNDSIANSVCLQAAMTKLKTLKANSDSSFVVVHFGDSHIQGDFMTGLIRKNLQQEFGSAGDGILFPYSAFKGYGPKDLTTVITGTWNYANLVKNPEKYPIGITGHTMVTNDKHAGVSFVYDPADEVANGNGKNIDKVTIWHGSGNFRMKLVKNGSGDSLVEDTTNFANGLRRAFIFNYKIGTELKIVFDTTSTDSIFNFHGISFEQNALRGLQYHRCGTVGATFLQLIKQQELTLAQLHEVNPDLVIFSYGSNESYDTNFSIEEYRTKVTAFIERIKKEFPGVNIIFTDTPDTRSRNRYPVNTIPINTALREIATSSCCGFWDLNTIMGGNHSIIFWLGAGLGAKDKLHFTRTGYALQANLFSLALLDIYSREDSSAAILCDTLRARIDRTLQSIPGNVVAKGSDVVPVTGSSNDVTHVVKSGESLSLIAQQYHVTVNQLCEWNDLKENSILHVGQKIVIKRSGG
jgi:LysM repeat protein